MDSKDKLKIDDIVSNTSSKNMENSKEEIQKQKSENEKYKKLELEYEDLKKKYDEMEKQNALLLTESLKNESGPLVFKFRIGEKLFQYSVR